MVTAVKQVTKVVSRDALTKRMRKYLAKRGLRLEVTSGLHGTKPSWYVVGGGRVLYAIGEFPELHAQAVRCGVLKDGERVV
jgi:hypothetical protein